MFYSHVVNLWNQLPDNVVSFLPFLEQTTVDTSYLVCRWAMASTSQQKVG